MDQEVGAEHIGLQIIDVSRPESPELRGLVQTGESTSSVFAVADGRAYFGYQSQVVTIDVTATESPRIIGKSPVAMNGGIDAESTLVFSSDGIWDFDDPGNPIQLAALPRGRGADPAL